MSTEDELLENPEFAYKLGKSVGHADAVSEAMKASEMGELELWMAYVKPKSIEGWREWNKKHPDSLRDRWKTE